MGSEKSGLGIRRITCGTMEKPVLGGERKLFGVCGIDTDKGTFQYDVEFNHIINTQTGDFKFDAIVTKPKESSFIQRLKKEFGV